MIGCHSDLDAMSRFAGVWPLQLLPFNVYGQAGAWGSIGCGHRLRKAVPRSNHSGISFLGMFPVNTGTTVTRHSCLTGIRCICISIFYPFCFFFPGCDWPGAADYSSNAVQCWSWVARAVLPVWSLAAKWQLPSNSFVYVFNCSVGT